MKNLLFATVRSFLGVLMSVLFSHLLYAQGSNITLVDHLDQPHGTSPQGTQYSSCWGWTSPTGKEYAFISTYTGTSIVDINTDTLKEIHFIPGPPSAYCYREVKTYKQYAYIVTDYSTTSQYVGIQILDLSGLPDTVVHVKDLLYVDPLDSSRNVRNSHTLTLADGYLYCNGSVKWTPGGSVIFSLKNDPTNPEYAGAYEPMYLHDTYVRNDTMYGAAISVGGGLFIADIKDKSNPILLGKITYPSSGTHNVWPSVDSKYVFTADEIGNTPHDMKVWALDSLPNSVKVAEWSADPTTSIHNVYGRGNYIYASHYKAGARIVDIHDPTNPSEVAYYDTYMPTPDPVPGAYAGCWGMFPYFPSGRILASDMQTGLYLFRFDGLKPRTRVHLLYPPDSSYSFNHQLRWTSSGDQANDPMHYELHIKGPSLDTVFNTRDTSYDLNSLPGVPGGTSFYTWFVVARDEFTEVYSQDTLHFYLFITSVGVQPNMPKASSLSQNYPNPFNPMTKIEFTLKNSTDVSLKLYDLEGKELFILLNHQHLDVGTHDVIFNASNISSGVYFYKLITPNFTQTKKMVLNK